MIYYPRWRPSEILLLRKLVSDRRYTYAQMSKIIGRPVGGCKRMVKILGISNMPHSWVRPVRNPDVSTWTEADRIAAWADVPQELAELVVSVSHELGFSVKEVRSNSRRRDLVECRQTISSRAKAIGFSFPLIGRAINRDHTSVRHLFLQDSSPLSTARKEDTNAIRDRIAA